MLKTAMPLILASGSPRRREILDQMGLIYTVDVSDVDESFSGRPAEAVIELSSRKAMAVARKHSNCFILAADTLVYYDRALGKPKTPEKAKDMLMLLAGKWHNVYTGLTLVNTTSGRVIRRMDRTRVHFVPLTQEEIDDYIATGEPLDKAGGYGIQGIGGMLIDKIEGSYSNVVGLPMAVVRSMITEMNEACNRELGVF